MDKSDLMVAYKPKNDFDEILNKYIKDNLNIRIIFDFCCLSISVTDLCDNKGVTKSFSDAYILDHSMEELVAEVVKDYKEKFNG